MYSSPLCSPIMLLCFRITVLNVYEDILACVVVQCTVQMVFHHGIPYSSKFPWSKNFMKKLKSTQMIIFVINISRSCLVSPSPLRTVLNFRETNFHDWMSNHKIPENIVPRKFGAIQYMMSLDLM